MDGLLECGLVEEAQERIEAGQAERFDPMILSIAVKKLRSQLAASDARVRELEAALAAADGARDDLVARGRALVAAQRRPAPNVARIADRRRARRAG